MAKKSAARQTQPPKRSPKGAAKTPPKRSGMDYREYLKKKAKSWEKSRKKEPAERGGGPADIPDGTYIAQVSAASIHVFKERPGMEPMPPAFKVSYVVREPGDFYGIKLTSFDSIDDTPIEALDGACSLDFLSERLQRMGYEIGELDLEELPDFAKSLSDEKPWFRVAVVNGSYTPERGKNAGKEVRTQKVYVNDALDEAEIAEIEEELAG